MKQFERHISTLLLLLVALVFTGCAHSYKLQQPPTEPTDSFGRVEVGEVRIAPVAATVEPGTEVELRHAIIEEITRRKLFQEVAASYDDAMGVMQMDVEIVEYEPGSRFARWFLGFGAGKAKMDVACRFINKETGNTFAEGVFTGKVTGGFFGGSAGSEKLSKLTAQQVGTFLKRGK